MAAPPVAETTGVAVRCRTLRAVNAPGMLARGGAADTPADQLAGPVGVAAGEGPPPWLPTVPQHLGIYR